MNRTVSIHQPLYFPWLGYFFKIASADVFVFLDDAQFVKNGLINRNRILTRQGIKWLSIPVKNRLGQAINETKFSDPRWRRKHLQTLRSVYGQSPGFRHIYPPLAELLEKEDWPNLAAINIAVVQQVCEFLKIRVPTLCASSMAVEGQADRRLAKIVRAIGGDTYLSGPGGANYQSIENFESSGIQLEYLEYPEFRYSQSPIRGEVSNGSGYQQPLSILDFLLTYGTKSPERFASFLGRERVGKASSLQESRRKYLNVVWDYMKGRLGWDAARLEGLRNKALSPGCQWVEIAHTPQVAHMGIIRMLCIAELEARKRDGVVCFAMNDHISVGDLPETRFLSLYCRGAPVRNPPRFGFPKNKSHIPLSRLAPPEEDALKRFVGKWLSLARVNEPKNQEQLHRISDLGHVLTREARMGGNAADWFVRVLLNLLEQVAGPLERVLVMPTSRFAEVFAAEFLKFRKEVTNLGIEPLPLWYYCGNCGFRIGRVHSDRYDRPMFCRKCAEEMPPRIIPDVVARQVVSASLAGFSLRVTGHRKEYADRADRLTKQIYDLAPVPRREVIGGTVVHHSGAPSEGNSRCSILQFAAEFPEVRLLERVKPLDDSDSLEIFE